MNNEIVMPIGIVDVFWDYNEYDEIKKAFYQLIILKKNDVYEYKNDYYFINNDLFVMKDETVSKNLKIRLLPNDLNDKLKLEICGDVLFLTKHQYDLLNETITKLQLRYNFEFELLDNSLIKGTK